MKNFGQNSNMSDLYVIGTRSESQYSIFFMDFDMNVSEVSILQINMANLMIKFQCNTYNRIISYTSLL